MKHLLRIAMIGLLVTGLGACTRERDGFFERTGESIDETVDDTQEAIEEAGEEDDND